MTYFTRVAGSKHVFCHNASLHNAQLAAAYRVLSAEVSGKIVPIGKTRPPPGHSLALDPALDALKKRLPTLAPIAMDEFPTLYSGQKRSIYENALKSLKRNPLTSKDATIKAFIKYEKMLSDPAKVKIPRMISPPSPRFLLATGCYVKAAEHSIYEAIDQMFGFKVVTKGLNYQQTGQLFKDHWNAVDDAVAFDVDVEKMDRSTSAEMLKWTHNLLLACFSADEATKLEKLLDEQLKVRTVVRCDDGVIRYSVDGTLTSGQMNTSLVGVSMVSCCMYTLFEKLGVPYRFVDAGDDCTVIVGKRHAQLFRDAVEPWFRQFGFGLTVGKMSTRLEHIEFCQTHPVCVNGKYTMVRNAQDAAVKDATSATHLSTKRERAVWMKAVSQCGMASHACVPVAQSLYTAYGRNADRMIRELNMSKSQMNRFEKAVKRVIDKGLSYTLSVAKTKQNGQYGEVTDGARVSYYDAFGIPPYYQVLLEDYYNNLVIEDRPEIRFESATFNPLWV